LPHYRELTVAAVRDRPDAEQLDVLFLESPRIYRLDRTRPGFAQRLERLKAAEHDRQPIQIGLAAATSDVIVDVGG
jgi:hypothetical protein